MYMGYGALAFGLRTSGSQLTLSAHIPTHATHHQLPYELAQINPLLMTTLSNS